MSTVTQNIGTAANKAWAAAAVTVVVWIVRDFIGIDVPAEVQGAVTTLLVWAVPNR